MTSFCVIWHDDHGASEVNVRKVFGKFESHSNGIDNLTILTLGRWLNNQHDCLLLWRSEFESCWSLQFQYAKLFWTKKRLGKAHFKPFLHWRNPLFRCLLSSHFVDERTDGRTHKSNHDCCKIYSYSYWFELRANLCLASGGPLTTLTICSAWIGLVAGWKI